MIRLGHIIIDSSKLRLTVFGYGLVVLILIQSCTTKKDSFTITNVSLFNGDTIFENVTISVLDGRIIGIGDTVKTSATVIDGTGLTLLPPLVNSHVHVWFQSELKDALNHGVSLLLDMNNTDDNAQDLRSAGYDIGNARILSSGPAVTVVNGHGTQFQMEIPCLLPETNVDSFVSMRVELGSDYVKLMVERAKEVPNWEQCQAVIKSAHKNGKLCLVHATKADDVVKLTQMGADGFMHLWNDRQMSNDELSMLSDSAVFIVPTLLALEKLVEYEESEFHTGYPYLQSENLRNEVARLHKAGVRIAIGTDSPVFGINSTTDLVSEMELTVEAGVPVVEVLKSATVRPLELFRIQTLEPLKDGSEANFIVVRGNPLLGLNCLNDLVYICDKGVLISPHP